MKIFFKGLKVGDTSLIVQEATETPTTDYALAIPHEVQCIAGHVWDVYSQQLLAGLCVPHTDLAFRTGGKAIGIGTGK